MPSCPTFGFWSVNAVYTSAYATKHPILTNGLRGQRNRLGRRRSLDTMSYLQNIDSMLGRAGRWFLRSGIQEANGGVARHYRSDLGQNARVSTEITGYAVSTLLYLAERTGDGNYTD